MAVKSGDQSWLDEQKLKGLYTSLVTILNLPLTLEARCDFLYRYAVSYWNPSDRQQLVSLCALVQYLCWSVSQFAASGFCSFFLYKATDGVKGRCAQKEDQKQKPNTRACSQDKQTVVRGVTGSIRHLLKPLSQLQFLWAS